MLGATRGLEVERRIRNWAIRVQFPPGAINFYLAWVLCRGHLFTGLITWADLRSVTKICQSKKHAAPSNGLSECKKFGREDAERRNQDARWRRLGNSPG